MSLKILKKLQLPLILLAVLLLPLLFGKHVPVEFKSQAYALSLTMKSLLEFILPFIIFSFLVSCLINLKNGCFSFVLMLIACIFTSNITAILTGYTIGFTTLSIFPLAPADIQHTISLLPAWDFTVHKLISNEKALMLGFATGILLSMKSNDKIKKIANKLAALSNAFLMKVFIPVLPIFILGFVFKLEHEHMLGSAIHVYGPIFFLVIVTQWCYLTMLYFVAGGFSFKKGFEHFTNVLPATLTGFTTISSAASMPVLILSTEENLPDKSRAQMLVPAIINIHTLGSAIAVSILALATMLAFDMPLPPIQEFIIFAFFFALAKYAVAAVPGGVMIVVATTLELHLGFSVEMVGLMTAVYMIFDPFGTAVNVTANGAFPIIFSKFYDKVTGKSPAEILEPIMLDDVDGLSVTEADS